MNEFLTCDEIKNLLSPYFDMELCDQEKNAVEIHIEKCSECRQELENIKQLSFSVKKAYQAEENPDEAIIPRGLLPEEIQKCLNVKANLSAFIDGELEKNQTIDTLEHILNCKFCRNQYEKMKRTRDLTRNYLENAFNNDTSIPGYKVHIEITERIRQQKNRTKILTSAAALIFVAVLSWFSVFQFNSGEPAEVNIDRTRFIRQERPMYVKAEDYILSELDKSPPKEVISLLYGE